MPFKKAGPLVRGPGGQLGYIEKLSNGSFRFFNRKVSRFVKFSFIRERIEPVYGPPPVRPPKPPPPKIEPPHLPGEAEPGERITGRRNLLSHDIEQPFENFAQDVQDYEHPRLIDFISGVATSFTGDFPFYDEQAGQYYALILVKGDRYMVHYENDGYRFASKRLIANAKTEAGAAVLYTVHWSVYDRASGVMLDTDDTQFDVSGWDDLEMFIRQTYAQLRVIRAEILENYEVESGDYDLTFTFAEGAL